MEVSDTVTRKPDVGPRDTKVTLIPLSQLAQRSWGSESPRRGQQPMGRARDSPRGAATLAERWSFLGRADDENPLPLASSSAHKSSAGFSG